MNPLDPLARIKIIWSDAWFRENCFALWEGHLKWLNDLGWDRALYRQDPPPERPAPTGHEVVDLLAEFVCGTGLVNAHAGLTSSDIVDNVRLMQVHQSLGEIDQVLNLVNAHLRTTFENVQEEKTLGFTHWQPAAPITWGHRSRAWLSPLNWLQVTRPCIFAKRFGGPVGDRASLQLLAQHVHANLSDHPFPWDNFELAQPNNAHPLQSSDHQSELHAAEWCTRVAAQLHKIAQDLRFLASHNLVIPGRVTAGSSSMPHKVNPFKWEKVCSLCRSVASTHREVWDVAAHNSLERTLDTSWQLKHSLQRMFETLALALGEFAACEIRVNTGTVPLHDEGIHSDRDLMRRILSGQDRWSAYWDMLTATRFPVPTSTDNPTTKTP